MANRRNTMLCLFLVYLGLSKGERNPHRQWHINAQRKDKARNGRKRGEYIFLKSQSCVIVAAHFFLRVCRAPLATHTRRDSLAAFSLWPIAVMSPQTKPHSSRSSSKTVSFPLLPAGYFFEFSITHLVLVRQLHKKKKDNLICTNARLCASRFFMSPW